LTTEAATSPIPTKAREFLAAQPGYAAIATVNRDGTPHQIVIWFLLRGDTIVVNSRHGRRWPSTLRREGRANLAVYEGEYAVTMECVIGEMYEGEEAQADIAEMARVHYTPEHAAHEIARYRGERRLSFVLRPVRVHLHGDLDD
jgi:hypothetical protein